MLKVRSRDAHFPSGNRETGNEVPGNFPREMGVFSEIFPILTKISAFSAQIDQNLTNLFQLVEFLAK